MSEDKTPLPLFEPDMLEAFSQQYRPWDDIATADKLMTDAMLRNELAAWPRYQSPDPLPKYKEELGKMGFRSVIDPSIRAPVIPVRYRAGEHITEEVTEYSDENH